MNSGIQNMQNEKQGKQVLIEGEGVQIEALNSKLSAAFDRGNSNSLVLLSSSIDSSRAMSESILRGRSECCLTLLVDYAREQIDEVNYWLGKGCLMSGQVSQIEWLGSSTPQKRQSVYLSVGVYAITSLVLLNDLLREQPLTHPSRPTHLIIQLQQPILSPYHRIPWLCTLLQLHFSGCSATLVCTHPHYYSKDFTLLYRALYCKRVIIWPFGRAELLKIVTRVRKSIREFQHNIPTTKSEQSIANTFIKLEEYVKTNDQTGFGFKEMKDAGKMRALIQGVEVKDKLSVLRMLDRFIKEGGRGTIWESNNSVVLELIHTANQLLREEIYPATRINKHPSKQSTQRTSENYKQSLIQQVDLGHLINKQSLNYKFSFNFTLQFQQNQKIVQLMKIINQQTGNSSFLQVNNNIQCKRRSLSEDQYIPTILIITKNVQNRDYVWKALIKKAKNASYINFLQEIFQFLHHEQAERVNKINRIYTRQGSVKRGWVSIKEDDRCIFQQMLFVELLRLFQLVGNVRQGHYLAPGTGDEQLQIRSNFQQRLKKEEWRFIEAKKMHLDSQDQEHSALYWGAAGHKHRVAVVSASRLTISQQLRLLVPQTVIFYSPQAILMRSLLLTQTDAVAKVKRVHTLLFTEGQQAKCLVESVVKEDEAFWSIAKLRPTLGDFVESAMVRRKCLDPRDEHSKARRELNSVYATLAGTRIPTTGKLIVVDTRELKSLLPSRLYHAGFQVQAVFLQTADYVLADGIGVERKAVRTKDLIQSLQSGRLGKQLERLCNVFRKPYLLIECQQLADCHSSNFVDYSSSDGKGSVRRQLMEMVQRHPTLRLLWATSTDHVCQIFQALKANTHDPDLRKFKTAKEDSAQEPLS